MVKSLPPKNSPLEWKVIAVGVFIALIRALFIILLLISGAIIIARYLDIVWGNLPSEIQKTAFDYSITIFTGTAAFILLYHYKFEEMVCELFGVKKVKSLKATE
jgi:hypothetical protein